MNDTTVTLDFPDWGVTSQEAANTLTEWATKPTINSTFGDDTPRTRKSDPVTSHAAADSNKNPTQSRALVLAVLTEKGPLADHELVEHLSYAYMTPQRIRTARHELVERGDVENAGYTRKTATNRNAVVWQIVRRAA